MVFLVIGVSLAFFFTVRNDYGNRFRIILEEEVIQTQRHIDAHKRVHNFRLKRLSQWLARHKELNFADAMGETNTKARQDKAFKEVSAVKALLQKNNWNDYLPTLVLLTDPDGWVTACDKFENPKQWRQRLEYPLIRKVVKGGSAAKDIWVIRVQNDRMMTVVAAPVWSGAKVVGVLILGYDHGDAYAEADKHNFAMKHFAVDVTYFNWVKKSNNFQIFGSTKTHRHIRNKLRALANKNKALIQIGKSSHLKTITIKGQSYYSMISPIRDNATETLSGYILLASIDKALAPVSSFLSRVPLIAALFLVVAIVLVLLIYRGVFQPYEKIEQGILEIIAGNRNHRFDARQPGQAGSMSHVLNLLVAALLGRKAPDEEEEEAAAEAEIWNDPLFIEELQGKVAFRHALEEEDLRTGMILSPVYYKNLFEEYIEAKKAIGDKIENVNLRAFINKLQKNEAILKQKYRCQAVKFQVITKNGNVILKPIPIKG